MGRTPRGKFHTYVYILSNHYFLSKTGGGVKGLSNELMQLRKICQHPFLFESVEDKINPGGMIDETIWRVAGKFELLNRILPKFFHTGHRVCVRLFRVTWY